MVTSLVTVCSLLNRMNVLDSFAIRNSIAVATVVTVCSLFILYKIRFKMFLNVMESHHFWSFLVIRVLVFSKDNYLVFIP